MTVRGTVASAGRARRSASSAVPGRAHGSNREGRDTASYSTRNTSKGALIAEAHAVFGALATGASVADVRAACLDGRLLRQRARETRRRIWEALHWRYFAWDPPAWVLADLAAAARSGAKDARFVGLAYVHYARRDRLTFDFVTEKLWLRRRPGDAVVRRGDVLDFLAEHARGEGGQVKWRETTRRKLAGNLLSALRDFGVLTGVQRKTLQRPVVAPEVALHLCRLLDAEGFRGRVLVDARDWRLFLWDDRDTTQALAQLAQRGDLRFERSARTVVLEIPAPRTGT